MRQFFCHVVAMGFLAGAGNLASANVIEYDLQNVVFDDGGSASGFATFDPAGSGSLSWNIATSSGVQSNGSGGPLSAFTYTNTDSLLFPGSGGCTVALVAEGLTRSLCLDLRLLADGSFAIDPGSYEKDGTQSRSIISGSVVDPPQGGGAAIPEPSVEFLLATAAALACAHRYFGGLPALR